MRFSIQSLRLLALALPLQVSVSAIGLEKRATVASWVTQEIPIALSSIFKNIGSAGAYALSADAGAVIASPSTSSPD